MSPKISLRIVLVLSFIGSGFSFFSYMVLGLCLPMVREMFASGAVSLPEQMMVAYESILEAPQVFYLLSGVFYGLSLMGAILMWNLNKTGFHCYTLAQLVLLAIPVLFLGKARFAIGDAMLTLLFVAYYFFTLRTLGVFSSSTPSTQDDPQDSLES